MMSVNRTNDITWNTDTMYALGLHRLFASVLGIWPPDRHKRISTIKVVIGSALQLAMIIIFTKDLITKGNCGAIENIVDVITFIIAGIPSIMKVFLSFVYKENQASVVNSAIEDWDTDHDEISRRTMLKYAFMGRIVLIIQMGGTYISVPPLILQNFPSISVNPHHLSENLTLPYRNIPVGLNCWISPAMPDYEYYVYYCFVTLCIIIVSTAYTTGDVYIFGMAMHVCGQFELLYKDMENIDGDEDYFTIQKKIRRLSHRHCHLLMLVDEFETSFSLLILVLLVSNTLAIGITGIFVLWNLEVKNNKLALLLSVRIYVFLGELYMYSYIGEHLAEQVSKLQVAVYNCTWYKMPPSLIRNLTFIMMRNNHPYNLTAGKIHNMNIANFQSLIKTMFSYFSVLRLIFDT